MLPTRFPAPARHGDNAGSEPLLPAASRAVLSEFVATALFVFAAEGSVFGLWKMYRDTGTLGGNALALSTAVALASNASGGHVNPAVVLVGRRISFARAVLYWAAQLLGAVVAAVLLRLVSGGMRPMGFTLGHALLLEVLMTFGLVYTVYATAVDHRNRARVGAIAPLAIGFVVGANILAGGPFDGARVRPGARRLAGTGATTGFTGSGHSSAPGWPVRCMSLSWRLSSLRRRRQRCLCQLRITECPSCAAYGQPHFTWN